MHEFHISISHTEWYLLCSRGEIVLALTEASSVKKRIIIIVMVKIIPTVLGALC